MFMSFNSAAGMHQFAFGFDSSIKPQKLGVAVAAYRRWVY